MVTMRCSLQKGTTLLLLSKEWLLKSLCPHSRYVAAHCAASLLLFCPAQKRKGSRVTGTEHVLDDRRTEKKKAFCFGLLY